MRGSTSSSDVGASGEERGASVTGPSTPLSRSTALASMALLATPSGSGSITNPFDVEPEQLTQPSCSPSMFMSRSRQTPGSRRSFRWSIEQMANLWPVNIEEEQELSLLQPARSDALYEEQSQQAIELFFSRHEIVPSPWEAPSKTKSAFVASKGLVNGNHTLSERQCHTSTAWSQTTLSIPPDADLSSLLGDYFTFHAAQDQQATSHVNHSRDSLRRKLFCNAVEAKTRTPDRCEGERLSVFTDGPLRKLSSTPVHMALCSSPIGGGGIRPRCSQGSSPEGEGMLLSPICRQARTRLGAPQQQCNLKLPEPDESPPSTDEDDCSDRTGESVATSGGAGDMSVLTAADRSDCMQLSPCSNGSRQREPL